MWIENTFYDDTINQSWQPHHIVEKKLLNAVRVVGSPQYQHSYKTYLFLSPLKIVREIKIT